MADIEEIIEGEVLTLAFGGEGILRDRGMVVFVPFTAPGDRVRARITQRKKQYARGELLEIIQPSPERIEPLCPFFGKCGGCQLQHLTPSVQNRYKSISIQESLKRIGHLPVDECLVKEATLPWAYRRSIRLGLRPIQNARRGYEMGYIAADHHTFNPIDVCPIFISQEDPLLAQLQECLKEFLISSLTNQGSVVLMKHPDSGYLFEFLFNEEAPPNAPEILQNAMKKWPLWRGVSLSTQDGSKRWGETSFSFTVEGLSFHASPSVFLQNHTDQSALLYREIVRQALESKASSILDLYCGVGVTSLLLAKSGSSVIGIELNPKAIAFACENAQANGVKGVQFAAEAVEAALPRLRRKHFDLILVNPPRSGLSSAVKTELLEMRPKTLIYVSCMPPTLARDLDLFKQAGYELSALQGWDMFPQTAHVETLAVMNLFRNSI